MKPPIAAILIALAAWLCAPAGASEHPTLITPEKEPLTLSTYKGKSVLVNFWATWCAPCRASFPWMNEMREKYQSQGLQIVAVSIDADKALARQFATELGARFEVGYDLFDGRHKSIGVRFVRKIKELE